MLIDLVFPMQTVRCSLRSMVLLHGMPPPDPGWVLVTIEPLNLNTVHTEGVFQHIVGGVVHLSRFVLSSL